MRKARTIAAAAVAAAAVAAGCGGAPAEVEVAATTPMVADLVRSVGGDRVEVTELVPRGADPHSYAPDGDAAGRVGEVPLIIRSGGGLDAWAEDLVRGASVVELMDGVPTLIRAGNRRPRAGTGRDEYDVHWWQDTSNVPDAVRTIANALADVDPERASAYGASADAYIQRLLRADAQIELCMSTIEPDRRTLVTAHDAFAYFAARFGVTARAAMAAPTGDGRARAGDTVRLAEAIERREVETVFPEGGVAPDPVEDLARAAGADVGQVLWADTLAPEEAPAGTYLGAMIHNVEAMAAAFSRGSRDPLCEPPLLGTGVLE